MAVADRAPSGSDHLNRREECASPALPPLAVGILLGLCAVKLLLHVFTSVRHY